MRELIQSLEGTEQDDPGDVAQAWAVELDQRATRAMSGETTGRDLDAVCDDLAAKRHPRR